MPNSPNSNALAGLTVLVTRPVAQAEPLCAAITAQGGQAVRLPTLEIQPTPNRAALLATLDQLSTYQLAIFTSANAVLHTLPYWPALPLPQLRIVALGAATRRTLQQHGLTVDFSASPPFNSEALLTLPMLTTVHGQRIVIFTGEHGRTLLADTLRQRGAEVEVIAAYRRVQPIFDVAPFLQQWRQQPIDIIISTSGESLQNLYNLLGAAGRARLLQTPLLVISPRLARLAKEMGFAKSPVVATCADDTALLTALKIWYDANHSNIS